MNQSILNSNNFLNNAYIHFQNGKFDKALQEYTHAMKNTYNDDLKANIKCTSAIIQQSLGHYEQSVQTIKQIVNCKNYQINNLTLLRIYANLTMFEILQGNFTKSLESFEKIMEIIQKQRDLQQKSQLLKFTTFLFFRITNLEQISEQIQNMDIVGMRIQELYSVSLMAFNSDLCGYDVQQKVQKMCYQEFIKNKRYDLALFSLRSLIFFTKNAKNRQFYDKQLAKLVMMGYFSDSIDFLNYQPYEVIQAIMDQFITIKKNIQAQIQSYESKQHLESSKKFISNDQQVVIEWKYTIVVMRKELQRTKQINKTHQKQICQQLDSMKDETNPMIIRSLAKNNYFHKYCIKVQKTLKILPNILGHHVNNAYRHCFQSIVQKVVLEISVIEKEQKESNEQKKKVKHDRSKSFSRIKEDKQNCPPLGISIVSIGSSKVGKQGRKKIFQEQNMQNSFRKLLKMVRICECGTFLNKRNFNSEGGQFKFVKITNAFIKWGKDPEKIENSCQIYPLKDIKSIIFGRVSPNLNENWNKMLNYENCFSLLLQKRTLDFYCKNYDELQAWICGLTHVLKKDGNKLVGYTPGKLRWKKMFSILRQNFIEPLKLSERHKYYYQNAYALKLFAKNGYKLPSKSTTKR